MEESAYNDPQALVREFQRALLDSVELYRAGADESVAYFGRQLGQPPAEFRQEIEALRQALLLKVFVEMVQADAQWSANERSLAVLLAEHLWSRSIKPAQIQRTLEQYARHAAGLDWRTLIAPFGALPPLRERAEALQTIVMRVANVVAKIDGKAPPETVAQLKAVQYQLWQHAHRDAGAETASEPEAGVSFAELAAEAECPDGAPQQVANETKEGQASRRRPPSESEADSTATAEQRLAEALDDLDRLVGLTQVKAEVRGLVNFLRVQQERRRHGLPQSDVSLHLVFTGNPGTGKTSVGRIVGRIFAALGLLERGHLVETDRSGLVAEYAGQTGPKTNQKIDEALDGVLFIDEAYSLISEGGDDAYGHEAVQVLLKRVEDDRDRLAAVLAGYTAPIARLLESNPGLESRFPRRIEFPDYSPVELCRILHGMCEQQHYKLPAATRWKLLCGFAALAVDRDEHFGNGRTARNVFERALRNMANRVADAVPLSAEALTVIEPDDVQFPRSATDEDLAEFEAGRIEFACTACGETAVVPAALLGVDADCPTCRVSTVVEWGEPLATAAH